MECKIKVKFYLYMDIHYQENLSYKPYDAEYHFQKKNYTEWIIAIEYENTYSTLWLYHIPLDLFLFWAKF